MDEEIDIINTNTRNERIKNFFINNRKSLISVFVVLILILCGYFLYEELQTRKKAKGLFNSDFANENELLNILNPVIKSESIWKPHGLYLMAEYYFANNQKQKSKDFFQQLANLENASQKIKTEALKRLRVDFVE